MAEKSKEPVITSPEDLMYEGTGQRTPTYDEILDALKFTMEMSPAGDVKNLYEGSKKMGTSPSIEALAQMGEGLVPLAMMATGPVGYGLTKGAMKGSKKAVEELKELIPIFPKPERMFPESSRPIGGEYLNPKTGDILTNKNLEYGNISITPEGRPKFEASPNTIENVGSVGEKGATTIKTNLFKKTAGWKWLDAPNEYKDIPTLISVENKGKHYYSLNTEFPKGLNLTRYDKSKTEPKLRPTIKGFIELGNKIGTISVRGKEHPVYDKIKNYEAGGLVTYQEGGPVDLEKYRQLKKINEWQKSQGLKSIDMSDFEKAQANEVKTSSPSGLSSILRKLGSRIPAVALLGLLSDTIPSKEQFEENLKKLKE